MRRSPGEFVREHVRMTLQPFDAPGAAEVARIVEQIGSEDILLYSSDYPHWHFDGDAVIPAGLSPETVRRMCLDNPLATYPRMKELVQ